MSVSDLYFQKTKRRYFMNITHLSNLPSIIQNGLLSYNIAQSYEHQSIALENVQARRHLKRVTNGLLLHDYASLYFDARNPMLFYLKNHPEKVDIEELCVLIVDSDVVEFDGTVITDGNAASGITKFLPPAEGIETINFQDVFAKYWNDDDPFVKEEKARKRCAEVLVPNNIPYDYILGAIVPSLQTKQKMLEMGFDKRIKVSEEMFFL